MTRRERKGRNDDDDDTVEEENEVQDDFKKIYMLRKASLQYQEVTEWGA